jgi:formate-dependent nitrite reductase membrane component NrfD
MHVELCMRVMQGESQADTPGNFLCKFIIIIMQISLLLLIVFAGRIPGGYPGGGGLLHYTGAEIK